MENYGFSVSCWQNTDSILSTINCLQALYLFPFSSDIPVAAIDDRWLICLKQISKERSSKVCLILMFTKLCGDKTFRNKDPSWVFVSPGRHVTSVFQGLSRVGENPGNQVESHVLNWWIIWPEFSHDRGKFGSWFDFRNYKFHGSKLNVLNVAVNSGYDLFDNHLIKSNNIFRSKRS